MKSKIKILLLFIVITYSIPLIGQVENNKYYYLDTISQKDLLSRLELLTETKLTRKSDFYFVYVSFGFIKTSGTICWLEKSKFHGVNFLVTLQDSIVLTIISKRRMKKFQNEIKKINKSGNRYFEGFERRLFCHNSSLKNDKYYISKSNQLLLEKVHYSTDCTISNNDKLSNLFFKALSIIVEN